MVANNDRLPSQSKISMGKNENTKFPNSTFNSTPMLKRLGFSVSSNGVTNPLKDSVQNCK